MGLVIFVHFKIMLSLLGWHDNYKTRRLPKMLRMEIFSLLTE